VDFKGGHTGRTHANTRVCVSTVHTVSGVGVRMCTAEYKYDYTMRTFT